MGADGAQRKCWWDGIEVELGEPAAPTKLWARRVWTLELSLVGAPPVCPLPPLTPCRRYRDRFSMDTPLRLVVPSLSVVIHACIPPHVLLTRLHPAARGKGARVVDSEQCHASHR
jgi:hypothetical protein